MNTSNLKNQLRQYGFLYLTTLIILLFLKLFYRRADSTDLQWLLAPTARWVQALSGISFENIPHIGYVNHSLRFIIARSCSGFQFMLITAAALIFSFLHRIAPGAASSPVSPSREDGADCGRQPAPRLGRLLCGFGCIMALFGVSYILTILVNGMRIILSIYLPLLPERSAFLQKYGIYGGWLTPDRLHTLIGTVVYFASLLAIYRLADWVTLRLSRTACPTRPCSPWQLLRPACWYFFFVLGIPLLNRAYVNGPKQFTDYAALVVLACTVTLILFALPDAAKRQVRRHIRAGK